MSSIRRVAALAAWGGGVAAVLLWPAEALAQRRTVCRVAEVILAPPDAQVRVGATVAFLATGYDANGNSCDDVTWGWQSGNTRAVTVDRNGIATATGVGLSIITASTGTGAARRQGQAVINVVAATGPEVRRESEPPPDVRTDRARPAGPGGAAVLRQPEGAGAAEALFVNPLSMVLVRGESQPLEYRALKSDGTNATPVPIVFTIEGGGESRVSVDTFGVVTSLGDTGVAIVRLTVPGSPRIQPKLVRVEVRGDSVAFARDEISLSPGMADTLRLVVPAQDGREMSPVGIFQYRSLDTAVVRVSPVRPYIEAVGPGLAQIEAQSTYYAASTTVRVHRRVASLAVEPAPADSIVVVPINGRVALRAQATGEDGSPVPDAPLRWTVPEDTTIVAFDSTARTVRGLSSGDTRLAVFVPGGRDTIRHEFRLRVVAGGLAASRPRIGMPHGTRTPIEVSMLDHERRPIGAAQGLTWRTSNDSVAVHQDGQIVARRPGRARLTATSPWDSAATVDVLVAGDLLVSLLREGRYDLYQLWPGGPPIPLTGDTAIETFPAWSPDLRQVAFALAASRGAPNRANLFVMAADGSERRQLTSDSALIRFISWAPRGRQLVFEWGRGGSTQIWAYDFDSNQARQLTSGQLPNTQPALSHDGRRVAVVGVRETAPGSPRPGIYDMALDGSGLRELVIAPRLQNPRYSPDGQWLFFLRGETVRRTEVQRVWRVRLSSPIDSAVAVTPAETVVQRFAISADGTRLACETLTGPAGGEQSRLQIFNIATTAFEPAPGLGPEDQAFTPAMRPAAVAPTPSPPR